MAKQYHLDLLNQGVEVWNRWREDNPLIQPDLSGLNLSGVHLEGANLSKTHLEGTNLCKAYLGGKETLPAANLQGAFFNKLTNLSDINLGNKESGFISVADVEWGEVSLTSIDWKRVNIIGDEYEADRRKQFKRKQLDLYHLASQSNRQLALTLQAQGLFNDGARFAYNAHRCEQKLFMLQVFLSLIQLLNKSWLVHVAVKKHYSRSMHRVLGGVFSVVTFAESGLFAVQHIGLPLIIFIVTLTYLIYLSIFKPLLRLTLFILSILVLRSSMVIKYREENETTEGAQ